MNRSPGLCLVSLITVLLLAGCSGMTPKDFRGNKPTFDPVEYFNGTVEAWGIVKNHWGSIRRRFYARFDGRKTADNEVRVDEKLFYSDGTTDTRVYVIKRKSKRTYTINTNDMVRRGSGIRYGNAIRWNYTLNVTVNGSTWPLSFTDWMILQDRRTMLNEATFYYYGIPLGNLTITFRKSEGKLVDKPYLNRL